LFSFGETALGGRSHPATQPAHPDQAIYQQVRAIANQLEQYLEDQRIQQDIQICAAAMG